MVQSTMLKQQQNNNNTCKFQALARFVAWHRVFFLSLLEWEATTRGSLSVLIIMMHFSIALKQTKKHFSIQKRKLIMNYS